MAEYKITIEVGQAIDNQKGLKTAVIKSTAETAVTVVAAKQIGQNLLNFASSRVEMYTGDSYTQAQVNLAMKSFSYAVGFAVNPLLTGIALGTSLITQALDTSYKHKWEMIGINDKTNLLGGLSYGRNRNK